MKKVLVSLWLICSAFTILAQTKEYKIVEQTSPDGQFTYQSVTNDALNVRIYKLKNGLTVMLSVNKSEPRIQTLIATKAGSKNDPSDNTGLAHYLEHLLFKGTDKYGTKDWATEKKYLDQIDQLYEQYNKTTDEGSRKSIYRKIDSVSLLASKYAIANEYDKMLSAIGASGTNAFTSLEQTVYVNEIPQNQVAKWIDIEAERFRSPVLRLFHTELEAVYEEKNISLDNDQRKVFEALMSNLFTKHTYGTQTTIGTVEHLKNPSLVKIRNYFNTYYVPNNMAIIMAGDLDPDATIRMINEKFAYMQPKQVPSFSFQPEPVRTAPTVVTVNGPDAENMMVGFRLPGAGTKEAKYLYLVDYLLANSKAGFIDLNLVKKQMVLSASSSTWINKDYSIHFMSGKPKQGQSLEQVKDLLLEQLNLIRTGAFDEESLAAIINNFKVDQIKNNESNAGRAYTMLESFIVETPWKDQVTMLDELSKITKQELVDFVNQYYKDDYVVIYKKIGEDKKANKIVKPEITPVEVNRDDMSPFVKTIVESPVAPLKPVYVDYAKDIVRGKINGKVPLMYVRNNDNGLFSLYYVLDMGKLHNIKLPMAINMLQYLGTDKYSAEQISKEFYKLACDFGVSATDEQVYVYVNGLDENFAPAVRLFEHLLANAKPDQAVLNQLVERTLKVRKDSKLNKQTIFNAALRNYAIYGKENPYTYVLSEAQLKALKAEELVDLIKNITSYQHRVMYYGPKRMEEVAFILNKDHRMPSSLKSYPKPMTFKRNETAKNTVYFVDYKMVQAEIMWLNKQPMTYDSTRTPMVTLYNEYFGGGMSSVVFQTIRESKALAYSTYSRYLTPAKKADPYYIIAYVGTQSDKLPQAVQGMNELLNDLPKSEASFNAAKEAIKSQIETERINKEQVFFSLIAAEKQGVSRDLRMDVYNQMDKLTFEDVKAFHEKYYKGKPFTYCIMGSKEKINLEDLKKYGEVKEVTLEEIFGY